MRWSAQKIWKSDCWIIGGGGSISEQFNIPETLVPETMEEFKEYGTYLEPIHKYKVIGVNIAAFLGDWVDVAYWGDSDTYIEYLAEYNEYAGLKVSSAGRFAGDDIEDVKYLNRDMSKGITKERSHISWCSKNSGASAINLAYHFGSKRIFLLGFDMYHTPSGRMHWHTGYADKSKTPTLRQLNEGKRSPRRLPRKSFKRHLTGWGLIAKDAERLGIEIINVNPKSEIKVFKKMSLEEVLNGINDKKS